MRDLAAGTNEQTRQEKNGHRSCAVSRSLLSVVSPHLASVGAHATFRSLIQQPPQRRAVLCQYRQSCWTWTPFLLFSGPESGPFGPLIVGAWAGKRQVPHGCAPSTLRPMQRAAIPLFSLEGSTYRRVQYRAGGSPLSSSAPIDYALSAAPGKSAGWTSRFWEGIRLRDVLNKGHRPKRSHILPCPCQVSRRRAFSHAAETHVVGVTPTGEGRRAKEAQRSSTFREVVLTASLQGYGQRIRSMSPVPWETSVHLILGSSDGFSCVPGVS